MNFLICIDKPQGITSQDAVTRAKKILRARKAGHTGTLDPMATGLLIICMNRATRLASYFSGLDKEYTAVMKLGETTETQDACGTITEKRDALSLDEALIRETVKSFEGRILQQPPMFSALKHKGTSLYKYARKGIQIDRTPREVCIRHVEVLDITLPYVTFTVLCSKGTYIRTLCNDIGGKLMTGAHLHALKRTAIGHFTLMDSFTFEELPSISEGKEGERGFYTMDRALAWLPELAIRASQIKTVLHGNPLAPAPLYRNDDIKTAAGIRIKSPDGTLLAIGSYSARKGEIKMDVVFT